MKTPAITIAVEATIRDAITSMSNNHTNSLVVVTPQGAVAGLLSTWDILQHVIPDYLESDQHLAEFESADTFSARILHVADDPITACMTTPVHTVRQEASLMEAATMLAQFRIRSLPIVDEQSRPIGFLSRTEIKKAIADQLNP